MTEILYEDFYTAVDRWGEVCQSHNGFESFIGTTVKAVSHGKLAYQSDRGVLFDVPDNVGYKINLLLSPHYRAIIKAYLITQDEELQPWK